MRFARLNALLFCFFITIIVFGQDSIPPGIQNLVMQYNVDRGSLERFYFISSSPERRQRMETFCADYSRRLTQLPFEKLNVSDRVDYILFKNQLSGSLE